MWLKSVLSTHLLRASPVAQINMCASHIIYITNKYHKISMPAMMFGKGEDNNYNKMFIFHISDVASFTKIILIYKLINL